MIRSNGLSRMLATMVLFMSAGVIASCTEILGIDTDVEFNPCTTGTGLKLVKCGRGNCSSYVEPCRNGLPLADPDGIPYDSATCPPLDSSATSGEDKCGDGQDNNCNGQVDEGCACTGKNPEQRCYSGNPEHLKFGLCQQGTQKCVDGEPPVWSAVCEGEVLPSIEVLDDYDNDCDGEVNEGLPCTKDGVERDCYPGPKSEVEFDGDTGAIKPRCEKGTQVCVNGFWSTCTGFLGPIDEVCNGLDDDCNGETDDNIKGLGTECPTGLNACPVGIRECVTENDEFGKPITYEKCKPLGIGQVEICDGQDNDCDGLIDEGVCCNDGILNGEESDTDCGQYCANNGGKKCADGQVCKVDSDCVNSTCDTVTRKCAPPTCADMKTNGGETDIDCGGPCATQANGNKKCALGKLCDVDADCTTEFCKPDIDNVRRCAKKPDGSSCDTNNECASNYCVDQVCCKSQCDQACRVCDGSGTCVPGGAGTQDKCGLGEACSLGGACKKVNGQECMALTDCLSGHCVDGVCCDISCTQTCMACNALGKEGTCSFVAPGEDDAPGCIGKNTCDGNGQCKKEQGQICTMNAECITGSCVDNVCCLGTCLGQCKACNVVGSEGTCADVSFGTDDPNGIPPCAGTTTSCDGFGACKGELGQQCNNGADCLSGNCVDGVCCNSACTDTCKSCNVLGNIGTCTNVSSGSNDPAMCTEPGKACNGNGECKKKPGEICANTTECISTYCVDGVCCDTACGDGSTADCQACSVAAGASKNGTCETSVGNTCRAANGACDEPEICNGTSTSCPADAVKSSTEVCRPATGDCDVEEKCNGIGKTCPADVVKNANVVCRAPAGVCDVAEICDGSTKPCPNDVKAPSTTVCRNKADVCDVAETCDGMNDDCPSDTFAPSNTVCRDSAGDCDVAETCMGSSAACPSDAKQPTTFVCRASEGECDVAETCNGTSNDCPTDIKAPTTTVCRPATDDCDLEETCDGIGKTCPADVVKNANVVCRAPAGACDVAEICDGSTKPCPSDVKAPSTTVCRDKAGVCDVAENCDGMNDDCPSDTFEPSNTVCRAPQGDCDVAETCTGSSAVCPSDAKQPATFVCRALQGDCDVAENCDGTSNDCPTDAKAPPTTVCRARVDECDLAETCNGTNNACPKDDKAPSLTVCRPSVGDCDVAESCDGMSNACPADEKATTLCRPPAGDCDNAETCDGSSADCPTDTFKPSSTECRPSEGDCDVEETCTGSSASCPDNVVRPGNYVCRPAAPGGCDVAETCTGIDVICPPNAFASIGTDCAPSSCANGTQTNADTCDGSGTCIDNGTTPCSPYICGSNACFTSCTTQTHCLSTHYCDMVLPMGVCQLKKPDSEPCQQSYECVGGYCHNNTCASWSCTDGIKNGDESDVDCGGSCSNACRLLLVAGSASQIVSASLPVDDASPAWTTANITTSHSDASVALTMPTSSLGVAAIRDTASSPAGKLRHATWSSGAWTTFTDVSSVGQIEGAPSLGASYGIAHAAYRKKINGNNNDRFFYAQFAGAAWNPVDEAAHPLVTNTAAFVPDVGSLLNGMGLMVYVDQPASSNQQLFIRERLGSGNWASALSLADNVEEDTRPEIVTLTNGNVLVAYVATNGSAQIWVRLREGTTWNPSVLSLGQRAGGSNLSLTALPGGKAMLAFKRTSDSLPGVSTFNGGTWGSFNWSTDSVAATPMANSISVTRGMGGNVAELAFVDSANKVQHTRFNGTSWTPPVEVAASMTSVAIAAPALP